MTATNGNGNGETRVKLLQKDVDAISNALEKLDRPIENLTQISNDIKNVIAVHDTKIEQNNKTICHLKNNLHERIDSLEEKIDERNKIQDEKISKLENWKMYALGATATVVFLLTLIVAALSIGV